MRNGFTAAQLAKLRTRPQGAEWYLAIHRPQKLDRFSLTNPSAMTGSIVAAVPATRVSASTWTVARFQASLVKAGMTGIVLGTNLSDILGEVRIRRDWVGSDTELYIAESGSGLINWTQASVIDVIDQYRPWIKHPRYDTDASQWRMDFDIAYDGQLNNWGPYANLGPPVIALPTCYVSSGEGSSVPRWVVDFWGGDSVSIQNIVSGGSWTFPDGQTVTSLIGTSSAPLKMTFSEASPGGSYFSFAVSDNTGASHIGRRLIFAVEDISQFSRVNISDITGGIEQGGYQARFIASNAQGKSTDPKGTITKLSVDSYPYLDNSEIVVFERAKYGNDDGSVGGNYGHRESTIFRGWITGKDVRISPFSSDMYLTAATAGEYLADADSYDIFLANYQAGGSDWTEMQGLCLDGTAQFALKWRSTLGGICDFYPMGLLGTTETILYQDLPRAPFFEQLRSNYGERGVLGYFANDMQSNMHAFQDINISGLSATTPRIDLENEDFRDEIEINNPPRDLNSQVSFYAVTSDIPYGAESPAHVRGYYGGERVFERGLLVDSQDRLITWTGNYRAKINSRFPRTVLRMANNMRIDPVPQSIVRMSLAASDNARGIAWSDKDHLVKELNVTYDANMGYPLWDLTVEEVVNGIGGSSITFPTTADIVPVPTNPPDPGIIDFPGLPPVTDTFGTGMGTVYALVVGTLYRTRAFSAASPTWSDITPSGVTGLNDFILDPWSPSTTGYLLGDDGVYRSTTLDSSTPSWTHVIDAAGLAALSVASSRYYKIVASINVQGYLSFIANTATNGVIHYYSTDGGDTWGYHNIARPAGITGALTQSGGHDIVPHLVNGSIVLYATFVETSGGTGSNKAVLVRSTDGGANWSAYGSTYAYSGNPFGGVLVHCPYANNDDGSNVYWGQYAANGAPYLFKTTSAGTTDISRTYTLPASGGIKRWMAETYTLDNQKSYQWEPFSSGGLYTSDDAGANWSAVSTTGINTSGYTFSTGGFPANSSQFYLIRNDGTSMKIYVSTDRGATWTNKTGNMVEATPGVIGVTQARCVIVPLWTE